MYTEVLKGNQWADGLKMWSFTDVDLNMSKYEPLDSAGSKLINRRGT